MPTATDLLVQLKSDELVCERRGVIPLQSTIAIGLRILLVGHVLQLASLGANPTLTLRPSETQSLGDEGSYDVQREGIREETFLFRLFVPDKARRASTNEKFPLVVWMHGHGPTEFSAPNVGHLFYIHNCVYISYLRPADAEFYLLAVQCPAINRPWFGEQPKSESKAEFVEPAEAVVQIVDRLIAQEAIDPDRVSVVGISSGGSAAWEMAMRYPDHFSAIAPLASAGGDSGRVALMSHIPAWAFYNRKDSEGLKEGLSRTIEALQAVGGHCRQTEVPGTHVGNHDAWHEAFSDHDLLAWLLAQERGQSQLATRWNWLRHTHLRWDYLWPRAVAFLIIGGCIGLGVREARRRRRRSIALDEHVAVEVSLLEESRDDQSDASSSHNEVRSP